MTTSCVGRPPVSANCGGILIILEPMRPCDLPAITQIRGIWFCRACASYARPWARMEPTKRTYFLRERGVGL